VLNSDVTASVVSTDLVLTPASALSPINEERLAIRVTNSVPAAGASLPVTITLNGTQVPVYDKFGNVLYGYGLRPYAIMKGYFGNNGADSTAHYQLINYPFIRYTNGL
jgi:hypothetical protein